MRNMTPVTMLWKVSLLLAVYLLAWAVWRCNDDFIERTTEQPQFHINDYEHEDNLLDILYAFDLKFQAWFDQTIVHHRLAYLKEEQFNIRWAVIEHEENVRQVMDDRKQFTIANFDYSLEQENRTESAVWYAAQQYLKFLASQRAKELNLYVGYLTGDYSILPQYLMSDPAYEKYIQRNLAMIEQNVTEIAKKLSLIDMNLTSMTSQTWNALISEHTPLMLPTCVNRYKPSQFYEGLLRNTSRTKTVMECSVKLQYQQSFPELVIILFFTTVIIGVIWTFAYFYRIKGHYHLMEDQELTSSGQNQYEARLLMDRLEQNGLLLKF